MTTDASEIVIEPAAQHAKPIYWEQADGRIVGGVKPEMLAMVNTGAGASFWIVTEYQGRLRWIRCDLLRSRQAFEDQRKDHDTREEPHEGCLFER